jgi:phosphatidylserine/phosphatidylglycerophosphate/cardiolipin synthase-like enzyme
VSERKAQHKKLLMVDGALVFLGSSNLTAAGTQHSEEMNLRVHSQAFARQVATDFKRLRVRAVPLDEWKE